MKFTTRKIRYADMGWEDCDSYPFSILKTTSYLPYNAEFVVYQMNPRQYRVEINSIDEAPALEWLETELYCTNLLACKKWVASKVKELQDIAVMVAIYRSASK